MGVVFLLMGAAWAGDVVFVLPWADVVGDPVKQTRAAARALDGAPTIVAAGDTLGDSYDLVDLLFQHPNELEPPMPDGLADMLAALQGARVGDALYVGVPYAGRDHMLYLWRWDAEAGRLIKVMKEPRGNGP